MVAVVDLHVERWIVIGAAAAAGLTGGLVHGDARAALGETHRGREPGEAGADDVDRPRHQMKAWRRMIHASAFSRNL